MPENTVSVVVCTRGRVRSLEGTLLAIMQCEIPEGWLAELLVIENGAAEGVEDVVRSLGPSGLKVRYLREERTGQCYARNRGLQEGLGSVYLFTDDDVLPPANWIEGMCRPILEGAADAVAGGVYFPSSYEKIFRKEQYAARRGWFACTAQIDSVSPDRMVGANMAFSKKVVQAIGGFDTNLGPGALGFYDESLFSCRLINAGFRLVSAFDIAVEHRFDLSRTSRRSMLEITKRMARSSAYVRHHYWNADLVFEKRHLVRAKLGLFVRKVLMPMHMLKDEPTEWELSRVEAIEFMQQFMAFSQCEPMYKDRLRPQSTD